MSKMPDYIQARDCLVKKIKALETEKVALESCLGRILGEDLVASENVPAFCRSPFDGYAFIAEDSIGATKENPVTLNILEEVPAGAVPTKIVVSGTACKILTGAKLPEGANVVTKYEETEFTKETVTLFKEYKVGANIIPIGEDVKKGQILAKKGDVIDGGLLATLAAQGIEKPLVYKRAKIGIISTGNEVTELYEELLPGKIYNTNRYLFDSAIREIGMEPVYYGIARDTANEVAILIKKAIDECDAVISTGGVSVGDYDKTPEACDTVGIDIEFRGVSMKPGMACCYGFRDEKLFAGLSGNPASALTNYYAVALPALKKLSGRNEILSKEFSVTLKNKFKKKSPGLRLLRGKMELGEDGKIYMLVPEGQENGVINSFIGSDIMAIIPAGSGPLDEGTVLKAFRT